MTTDDHNQESIKSRVLKDIHAGQVAMRPKVYFTLQIGALLFTAAAALAVSIFIFNFILFSIRINSHDALLSFGPRGWEAFITFFPWPLLLIDIGLVLLLELLLRQFKFGYKIPILYLLGGLLLVTATTAILVDRGTPFNDRLFEQSHRLPAPVGGWYENARRPLPPGGGICKCTVRAILGNTLTVEDTRKGTTTLTVILPANSRRATSTGLKVGDTVFIAGEEEGGVIRAFGVRKESNGFGHWPHK